MSVFQTAILQIRGNFNCWNPRLIRSSVVWSNVCDRKKISLSPKIFLPNSLKSRMLISISNFAKPPLVFGLPFFKANFTSENSVLPIRGTPSQGLCSFLPTKISSPAVGFVLPIHLCLCHEFHYCLFRNVLLLLSRPVYRSGCITIFAEEIRNFKRR